MEKRTAKKKRRDWIEGKKDRGEQKEREEERKRERDRRKIKSN